MPTPAEELRAAAFQLRNPFHLPGLTVGIDPDLATVLADWLDRAATGWESLRLAATILTAPEHADAAATLNSGPYDAQEALSTARLINAPEEPS